MRFMDNIIDVMDHPDNRFKEMVTKYRPVGIGMMGLSDVLYQLDLRYDSVDGKVFSGRIMKTITNACIECSADLANERGTFADYDIVKDDVIEIIKDLTDNDENIMSKVRKYGLRNVQHTTCAPTGTTALSCDCSYGMEPCFGLVFQKNLIDGGTMNITNKIFSKYSDEEWYNDTLLEKIALNNGSLKGIRGIPKDVRDVFVTAHDIKYKDRIDMQSELQKYVSSAISSTINLPKDITIEEISDLYKYAYERGLKGVTVYRDGSKKFQPITFDSKKKEAISFFNRPSKLSANVHVLETGNGKLYVTISTHNGKPVEIFMNMGKSGQLFNVFTESLGRSMSISLQNNVPVQALVDTLIGINSDRTAWHRFEVTDKKPTQILSIPDGIAKLLQRYYLNCEFDNVPNNKELCNKCGTYSVILIEGCKVCQNCGESKCN